MGGHAACLQVSRIRGALPYSQERALLRHVLDPRLPVESIEQIIIVSDMCRNGDPALYFLRFSKKIIEEFIKMPIIILTFLVLKVRYLK